MLILSRKTNESIMIGEEIEVSIVDVKGDQVKIGIKAPKNVKIYRQEVYKAIQEENIKAAQFKAENLPELNSLINRNILKKEQEDSTD